MNVSGEYCVYKVAGAHCPGGFREGWIYWDDAAPWFGDSEQGLAGEHVLNQKYLIVHVLSLSFIVCCKAEPS